MLRTCTYARILHGSCTLSVGELARLQCRLPVSCPHIRLVQAARCVIPLGYSGVMGFKFLRFCAGAHCMTHVRPF
jgi:hypothetical protein